MPKKWTVMVYLAGDNNLSEEMIYSIKEMYRVGASQDFAVTIQFDPSAIGPMVRRYEITREKIVDSIARYPKLIGVAVEEEIAASVTTFERIAASIPKLQGIDALQNPRRIAEVAVAAAKRQRREAQAPRNYQPLDDRDFPVPDGLDLDGLIDLLKVPEEEVEDVRYPENKRRALINTGEINSANPRALRDFVNWSIGRHPAERYMLVLSGHGSGAIGDFLRDENALEKIDRPTSLSIPNLRIALDGTDLPDAKQIHILGMDSCLMSMVEVGYELRGRVKFLVGSEGFVLNTGWPYHRILQLLKEDSEIEEKEFAKAIVKSYISYYDDYEVAGASTDMSVCNLGEFEEKLKPEIENLAQVLIMALDKPELKDAIVLAHWEAQSYKSEQYTDLYDFCERLQLRCIRQPTTFAALRKHALDLSRVLQKNSDSEILKKTDRVLAALSRDKKDAEGNRQLIELIATCDKLNKVIKDNVVSLSCYSGPTFQHSNGLSIFFPWFEDKEALNAYEQLAFANKHAIVMQEGARKDQIKNVEQQLKAKRLTYRYLEGDRGVSIFVGNGDVDIGEFIEFPEETWERRKDLGISNVLTGTGWVSFLREYLKATRRDPREQAGEEFRPIRPEVNTIAAASLPPVRNCLSPKGLGLGTGSMKNPPDGFYRDKCGSK